MDCRRCRRALPDVLDGAPAPTAVLAHVLACRPCRCLHDELRALAADLPLAFPERERAGLTRRLLARVPPPPPIQRKAAAGGRAAARIAWLRAAAWALVFLGATWQLAGSAVTTLALEEVVPAAERAVTGARTRLALSAATGDGLLAQLHDMGTSVGDVLGVRTPPPGAAAAGGAP